jgi:hypothetical protein
MVRRTMKFPLCIGAIARLRTSLRNPQKSWRSVGGYTYGLLTQNRDKFTVGNTVLPSVS